MDFTPLNILNGTPEGVPLDVSRATLPINQLIRGAERLNNEIHGILESTVIFDDRSNSNVHRCNYVPVFQTVSHSAQI